MRVAMPILCFCPVRAELEGHLPASSKLPQGCHKVLCVAGPSPQVVAAYDHTLVLTQDGSLFTFGDNSLCQLGRPSQLQVRSLGWLACFVLPLKMRA